MSNSVKRSKPSRTNTNENLVPAMSASGKNIGQPQHGNKFLNPTLLKSRRRTHQRPQLCSPHIILPKSTSQTQPNPSLPSSKEGSSNIPKGALTGANLTPMQGAMRQAPAQSQLNQQSANSTMHAHRVAYPMVVNPNPSSDPRRTGQQSQFDVGARVDAACTAIKAFFNAPRTTLTPSTGTSLNQSQPPPQPSPTPALSSATRHYGLHDFVGAVAPQTTSYTHPSHANSHFPATPSQRAIPVQPGQAAAQAVAAGTSAAPPTAKQNLASTPPNNPVWYNQGGTPVATARTTLTPRVSQGDIDHGVSDCIHSLTHLDFEALADSLRLKIDYVKWCLTDPANISKLTIAQIRLCVKYVSDKFKITYKSPYLKYQWVALLESMLFKSRVVKEPENVINSPYQVRFNNATASPSTPTPALPSVPRFEGTPKTPVPRAPGVPAATTPRFQPFTPNAQNPLAASSTPTKTISFPIRLLCEAKPILTKLYQRLKMIPSEFGSFYDFVGLLDAKDLISGQNVTSLSFKLGASDLSSLVEVPNKTTSRILLLLLKNPKTWFSSTMYQLSVNAFGRPQLPCPQALGSYPFYDLTKGMLASSGGNTSATEITFQVQLRPNRNVPVKDLDVVVAVFLMDQLDVEQRVSRVYEDNIMKHLGEKRKEGVDMPQYLSLRPSTPRDLTALRRQALENVALDNKVMDRKASSGDVEIGDSIVSFMCPLTLVRIEHPAKGADCKHVQCFDLKSFCAMLNLGSFWKCSVCGRVLRPSSIVLDIPFLRLLKAYPNDTKCIVKPDGTDAPFHNSHEDGIDITEDPPERCDTPETDRSHLQITSSQSSPAGLKRKAVEVIDVDSFDADVFVMRTKMRSPEEAKVGTKMIVSIDID